MSVEIATDLDGDLEVAVTRNRSKDSETIPDTRHRARGDADTLPDQAFQSPTRTRAKGVEPTHHRISQSTHLPIAASSNRMWGSLEEEERISIDFTSLASGDDHSKRGRALTKLLKSASAFVEFDDTDSFVPPTPSSSTTIPPPPPTPTSASLSTAPNTTISSTSGPPTLSCVVCFDHVLLTSAMILNSQDRTRKLCPAHFKEWLKLEDSKRRCAAPGCRRPASYLSYRHRECCHTHFREMFDIDTYAIRLLGANDPTLRESIVQSSKLIALGIPKDPSFLNSLEGVILFLGEIFVPESSREGWMKLTRTLVANASQEIISIGDRVEVFGLESVAHNGLQGNVVVLNGGRLEVVLETAEVARFKAGNVRKIPDHVDSLPPLPRSPTNNSNTKDKTSTQTTEQQQLQLEYVGIRSLLSFLLLSLHHRTCATLTCTCPSHPCPIFSLRVIFISRVLLQHFQPLLGHSCREVQDLSIKVMWRLFQFYAVLPPCNRFQALAMQPPSEKKLLGFLSANASRKSSLSVLNVLLELATMKVSLPNITSTEISQTLPLSSPCSSNSSSSCLDESKRSTTETTVVAADSGTMVVRKSTLSSPRASAATATTTPTTTQDEPSSSASSTTASPTITRPSTISTSGNHSRNSNSNELSRTGSLSSTHSSSLLLIGIDLSSLSSIGFSWETQASIDLFRCKVENACLLPHIFRLVARAGENDRLEGMKMMFSMLVGKALSVDTVLQMRKWPFWILEIMASLPASVLHSTPRQSASTPRHTEVGDSTTAIAITTATTTTHHAPISTANAETLMHCVAFFEYIMTHAFKNFKDRKFAFLVCDTLALIRRFSGGWTTKSLTIARKILAVLVKRAVADHRLIRNDVDGIRWRNTIHLAGIITQFTLFVGDDASARAATTTATTTATPTATTTTATDSSGLPIVSPRSLSLKPRDSSNGVVSTVIPTFFAAAKSRSRTTTAGHARTWSSSLQSAIALAQASLSSSSSTTNNSNNNTSSSSSLVHTSTALTAATTATNTSHNNVITTFPSSPLSPSLAASSTLTMSTTTTTTTTSFFASSRRRSASPSFASSQNLHFFPSNTNTESLFSASSSADAFSPLSSYAFSPTSTFSVSSSCPSLRQSISSSLSFAPFDTTGEFTISSASSPLAPLSGSLLSPDPSLTPRSPSRSPSIVSPSDALSPPTPTSSTRSEEKSPSSYSAASSRSSDCLLENHWRTTKKLLWYWDNALDPDLQGVKLHREAGMLLDHPLIADAHALFKLLHLDDMNMFGDLSVTAEGKAQLETEHKLYKFLDRLHFLFATANSTEICDFVKEHKKLLGKWSKSIGYTFATIEDRGLMEGVLRIPSNGNKDYFFSMTPSSLRFNEGTQLLPSHKSFTKLPASDCSGGLISQAIMEEEEEKKGSGGYEFQFNTPKKSFSVVAATLEERDGWLSLLALLHKKKYAGGGSQRLSSNLLANTSLMFGAVTNVRGSDEDMVVGFIDEGVAPVWVTKQDVSQCHLCKSTFSLVRLKHWCRICGQVFCHSCCKEKLLLPMYVEPERVCRTCVVERQRVEHRKKVELMKMMHYRSSVLYKTKEEYLEERNRLRQSAD